MYIYIYTVYMSIWRPNLDVATMWPKMWRAVCGELSEVMLAPPEGRQDDSEMTFMVKQRADRNQKKTPPSAFRRESRKAVNHAIWLFDCLMFDGYLVFFTAGVIHQRVWTSERLRGPTFCPSCSNVDLGSQGEPKVDKRGTRVQAI